MDKVPQSPGKAELCLLRRNRESFKLWCLAVSTGLRGCAVTSCGGVLGINGRNAREGRLALGRMGKERIIHSFQQASPGAYFMAPSLKGSQTYKHKVSEGETKRGEF